MRERKRERERERGREGDWNCSGDLINTVFSSSRLGESRSGHIWRCEAFQTLIPYLWKLNHLPTTLCRPGYVYKLHPHLLDQQMKTASGWTPQRGGSPEQNGKENRSRLRRI